jgi:uncharacterized protein YbjT (DUF2867 family)
VSLALVIGATGTIGRHVARQLLDAGHPVRVLARDPAKAAGIVPGAEIVVGDLARPETLPPAFAGSDRVFVLAPPAPDMAALEAAAFDAARAAGARHVVYLSNFGAGAIGPAESVWGWHGVSERRLRDLGVPWTILRPARFMSDTPFPWSWDHEAGVLAEPLGGGRVTLIAPEDVAAVAVKALSEPGHEGRTYELTSATALAGEEIAQALTAATGAAVRFVDVSPEAAREPLVALGLPPVIADTVMEYFASVRQGRWYLTTTARDVLGREPLTYPAWLARHLPVHAG